MERTTGATAGNDGDQRLLRLHPAFVARLRERFGDTPRGRRIFAVLDTTKLAPDDPAPRAQTSPTTTVRVRFDVEGDSAC